MASKVMEIQIKTTVQVNYTSVKPEEKKINLKKNTVKYYFTPTQLYLKKNKQKKTRNISRK